MKTIEEMTTKELQAFYAEVYDKPTTNRNAKRLRVKLAPYLATRKLHVAKAVERAATKGRAKVTKKKAAADHTPKSIGIGRVLTHQFRGANPHVVKCTVVEEGFKVGRVVYTSLGAAAKAASGQQWNGVLFWGLAPFPKHRKKEAHG